MMYYFWLGKDSDPVFQDLLNELHAKRRIGYMYGDIWYV